MVVRRCPLFDELPTYVMMPGELIKNEDALEFIKALSPHFAKEDLSARCPSYRQFRCDPGKRASAELRIQSAGARLTEHDSCSAKKKDAPSEHAFGQIQDWWAIVTDPDHVHAEIAAMPEVGEMANKLDD